MKSCAGCIFWTPHLDFDTEADDFPTVGECSRMSRYSITSRAAINIRFPSSRGLAPDFIAEQTYLNTDRNFYCAEWSSKSKPKRIEEGKGNESDRRRTASH